MENAARALEISAGVLLGVMLMALVAYFFASISKMPENEDQILTAEQLATFNREYEVYNKQQMYGVDVISCLNKAISNDNKYVKGEAYFAGKEYGKNYLINVYVTLNGPLQESIELTIVKMGESKTVFAGSSDLSIDDALTMKQVGFEVKELSNGAKYTKYNIETDKAYPSSHTLTGGDYMEAGTYKLLESEDSIDEAIPSNRYKKELISLLSFADHDNMRQVRINRTSENLDKWGTAIWNTALYDFKKKRFKCDGIDYNPETARVMNIHFVEI